MRERRSEKVKVEGREKEILLYCSKPTRVKEKLGETVYNSTL